MDSCKISEKDILLIRDVVLEMLQRGELQHGLHNCNGDQLGGGVRVVSCCPGCGDTPPSAGPDSDTKNARMEWHSEYQRLSLIDTLGGEATTHVYPDSIDPPPANSGASIKSFIGVSKSIVMGQPSEWMRIVMPDGRVGKIPVYTPIPTTSDP